MHEVLTERRDDDVDLSELIDRLRSMLVQGVGAQGRESSLEPVSLAGARATALALVFSELLQNALEHGGDAVASSSRPQRRRRARDRRLGAGRARSAAGTGLSIVRALVRTSCEEASSCATTRLRAPRSSSRA